MQSEDENERTKDDIELRRKLINNFVKRSSDDYNEMIRALNAGDIKLAHRKAHALKGNAGLLGITALQYAARDVEDKLKDGINKVTGEQLTVLEKEYNAALAELEPLVKESYRSDESDFTEPLDPEELQELKINLETLLVTGNMECIELIDKLRRIPGTTELILQIDDLDFRKALLSLSKLNW